MIKLIYISGSNRWTIDASLVNSRIKILGDVQILEQTDPIGLSLPISTSTVKLNMPPAPAGETNLPLKWFDRIEYYFSGTGTAPDVIHWLDEFEQDGDFYTLHLVDALALFDNRKFYGRTMLAPNGDLWTDVTAQDTLNILTNNSGLVVADNTLGNTRPLDAYYPTSTQREALGNFAFRYNAEAVYDKHLSAIRFKHRPAPTTPKTITTILRNAHFEKLPLYTALKFPSYRVQNEANPSVAWEGDLPAGEHIVEFNQWFSGLTVEGAELLEHGDVLHGFDAMYAKVKVTTEGHVKISGNAYIWHDDTLTVPLTVPAGTPENVLEIKDNKLFIGGYDTAVAQFKNWYENTNAVFKGRIKAGTERIGDYVKVVLGDQMLVGWISSMNMKIRRDVFADVEIVGKLSADTTQKYTVTFTGGSGATGTPPTISPKKAGESFVMPVNTFTRTGYTFVAWQYNNQIYDEYQTFTMPAHNVTFTVKWKGGRVNYTVKHFQQNVTGDGYTLKETETLQGNVGELTQAVPKNYTGFRNVLFTQATIASSGTVVNINYDRVLYFVTFNSQGGTDVPTQSVRYQATATVPTEPIKPTLIFNGWYKDQACAEPFYFDTPITGNVTLYAAYTTPYTATFVGGDGATGNAPLSLINLKSGQRIRLPENTFTKTDYVFVGWNDGIEAGVYRAHETYTMPAANVTFTAQWTQQIRPDPIATHTVTYTKGGTDVTGTEPPSLLAVAVGAQFTIPSRNTLEKAGYRFAGWKYGNTVYQEGELFTMPASNVTFTAQWKTMPTPPPEPPPAPPTTYSVTFTGGSGASGTAPTHPAEPKGVSFSLPENTFVKTGYKFTGWKEGNTVYQESEQYTMPARPVTFTAQWALATYKITYTINHNYHTRQSYQYGATITAPSYSVPTGYTFSGWTPPATMPAHDVTADATLTANVYTISYTLNGGEWAGQRIPTQYTVADLPLVIPKPYKTDNEFAGWTGSNGSTYQKDVTIPAGSTGNKTYTAHWTAYTPPAPPTTYSVTYDKGGADVAGTPPENRPAVLAGGQFAIPNKGTLGKSGYSFNGWKYGNKVYFPRDSFTMPASNVTFVAQWAEVPKTYNVSYNIGNTTGVTGDPPPSRENVAPGTQVVVAGRNTLAREGYTFWHWMSPFAGRLQPGDIFTMPARDIVFLAVWEELPPKYYVRYDKGGTDVAGTPPPSRPDVAPGSSVKVFGHGNLEKPEHRFRCWNYGGTDYYVGDIFTMPEANVTLTAQWQALPPKYYVTYEHGSTSETGVPPPARENVAPGTLFAIPGKNTLANSGLVFVGWKYNNRVYLEGDIFTMPTACVTFVAQWKTGRT